LAQRKKCEHGHCAAELHDLDIAGNARDLGAEHLRQAASDHRHARDQHDGNEQQAAGHRDALADTLERAP
jgi:hypothetical protein